MLAAISILKWSLDFVCKQGGITKSKEETAGGSAGKESTCNVGDLGSIPGLEKIPWRREWLPPLLFWPAEFHGLYSP